MNTMTRNICVHKAQEENCKTAECPKTLKEGKETPSKQKYQKYLANVLGCNSPYYRADRYHCLATKLWFETRLRHRLNPQNKRGHKEVWKDVVLLAFGNAISIAHRLFILL